MPARSVRVVCFVPSLDLRSFYLRNVISCFLQLGSRHTHGHGELFLSRFPSPIALMFLILSRPRSAPARRASAGASWQECAHGAHHRQTTVELRAPFVH